MLALILIVWVVMALGVGATGVLRELAVPPPAIAMLLTIVIVMVVWLAPAWRKRVQALGAGPLVAVHVTRLIIGIYFLVLAHDGTLPKEFATPAGWGDIVIGATALVILVTCVPVQTSGQRFGLLVWNTAGLADILLVLGNGMRLFARDAAIGTPFTQLPLALLPLLVVPLVISTHLWLFTHTSAATAPLRTGTGVAPQSDEPLD